jgi:hypothetical protein
MKQKTKKQLRAMSTIRLLIELEMYQDQLPLPLFKLDDQGVWIYHRQDRAYYPYCALNERAMVLGALSTSYLFSDV